MQTRRWLRRKCQLSTQQQGDDAAKNILLAVNRVAIRMQKHSYWWPKAMLLPANGPKIEATAVTDKRNFLYDKGIEELLILGEFETRSGVVDWQAKHEHIRCQNNSLRQFFFVPLVWFLQPWWQRLQGMAWKIHVLKQVFFTSTFVCINRIIYFCRQGRLYKSDKPWKCLHLQSCNGSKTMNGLW